MKLLCCCSSLRSSLASSLFVKSSVSNPLPVRLTETSPFICPTLCLPSASGCLPLPLLLSLSARPPFPFSHHLRRHSVPLLRSCLLLSLLICPSSPSSSLALCPLSYLLGEGQYGVLAAPSFWSQWKNKQVSTCSRGILMTSITQASLSAKPRQYEGIANSGLCQRHRR